MIRILLITIVTLIGCEQRIVTASRYKVALYCGSSVSPIDTYYTDRVEHAGTHITFVDKINRQEIRWQGDYKVIDLDVLQPGDHDGHQN